MGVLKVRFLAFPYARWFKSNGAAERAQYSHNHIHSHCHYSADGGRRRTQSSGSVWSARRITSRPKFSSARATVRSIDHIFFTSIMILDHCDLLFLLIIFGDKSPLSSAPPLI
jgi:hypothetical protein